MRNVANWRKIAQESKDILTVCLATVIDQAMTAQKEPTWFAVFVNEDSHEKPSNRITKSTQKSVYELDIQALLKFMRYRPKWADSVLNYYGFYQGLDEFAADGQRKQLESLLDRLIVDYRNRIEAHSRAADLAGELNGQGMERCSIVQLSHPVRTVGIGALERDDRQNRQRDYDSKCRRAHPCGAIAQGMLRLCHGFHPCITLR